MTKKKKTSKNPGMGIDLLNRTKDENKVQKPSKYQVVFHNDDYTPFQFVVIVLMTHFRKSAEQAWSIAQHIHEKGKGIAGGPYSKEIAETKAKQVINIAREAGFPLLATVEKAS